MEKAMKRNRMVTIIGSILVVLAIGVLSVLMLHGMNSKVVIPTNSAPEQRASEKIEKATTYEQHGDTEASLREYRAAYEALKQADDKLGVESIKAKISYLEKVLIDEKKRKDESPQDTPRTLPSK